MRRVRDINCELNLKKSLRQAYLDLINSFIYWRIFYIIGVNEVGRRYARSKIGHFWLTLSLAINVITLSVVWSYLFKMRISEYLPFFATGTIFWTYISNCINEGSYIYITSSPYIREINIPKLSYINSLFIKNIIILMHNLIVLIPIYLYFYVPVSVIGILLSLLGFFITSMFLFPIIMFVSLMSLRFRDLPNITSSLIQITFYITPIMWKVDLMPEKFSKYFICNPFAVFLSILRNPLFAKKVPNEYYVVSVIYILLAWFLAFSFFSKFRSRIVYWL